MDQGKEEEGNKFTEQNKIKRLPRSAKKRLKYEKLREQRKLHRKKKKIPTTINKIDRRQANERLETINQQETTALICIDCAYNQSMSNKVRLNAEKFQWIVMNYHLGNFQCCTTDRSLLQFQSSIKSTGSTSSFELDK